MAYDTDAELNELRRRRIQQLQEMQSGQSVNGAFAAQQQEQERREQERSGSPAIVDPGSPGAAGTNPTGETGCRLRGRATGDRARCSGRLQRQIDDPTLRALLERIMPGATRNQYHPAVTRAGRQNRWRIVEKVWRGSCGCSRS